MQLQDIYCYREKLFYNTYFDTVKSMKFLLWFGMSQTGKSSSVKLLTGDKTIQCGVYGKAQSTTSLIQVYQEKEPKLKEKYHHIDTIGVADNRLKYNDQEIKNQIQNEIIKISRTNNVDSISAIIVTESLKADLLSLRPVFQHINSILGNFPKESIIILGTKKNQCNHVYYETKVAEIKKVMSEFGVPVGHYLDFLTPCPEAGVIEGKIDPSQYTQLSKLIQSRPGIRLQSITKKQAKIKARATAIQKEKTTINIQKVKTQEVEYRTQKKPRTISVPRQKWQGGLGKIFGQKKIVWEQQVIYEDTKVPYTKQVEKEVRTPVVPEFEYCHRQALEEFDKSFVKSFLAKAN